MADEPRDPDLEAVLDLFREKLLERIRTKLPGTITAYDPATQLASAQPAIQERKLAEDGETLTAEPLPASHRCVVVFPRGAKGGLTYPVAVGDPCVILYCSSSIARYVAGGASTTGGQVDPGDDRHHDLSDAIVIVGGHPAGAPPTDAPTDAVVLHAAAGIKVKLGSSAAAQPVPRGNALVSAIDDLASAIQTAIGTGTFVNAAAVATAIGVARTAFTTAASTYLSQIVTIG